MILRGAESGKFNPVIISPQVLTSLFAVTASPPWVCIFTPYIAKGGPASKMTELTNLLDTALDNTIWQMAPITT